MGVFEHVWDFVCGERCVSIQEMTKRSFVYVGTAAAAGLLALCICASSSCDSHTCGGQRTLVERYVGYENAGFSTDVSRCFGPTSDCAALCEGLAIDLAIDLQNNGQRAMTGTVVLCERVPSPDGWADGGYRGWEDTGYVEHISNDGGTVDPERILHLIAGVVPFCGT
jgi:hypothetical protein